MANLTRVVPEVWRELPKDVQEVIIKFRMEEKKLRELKINSRKLRINRKNCPGNTLVLRLVLTLLDQMKTW